VSDVPMVTVLIPARNEERDIERCLRAVLAQDHPHDRMEVVIVVDAATEDRTRAVARDVLRDGAVAWTVLESDAGATPSNLNAGLAVADGSFLCRVDARSLVPPHYVRTCVEVLQMQPGIAVVGGAQIAHPRDASARASGIARALNNRYAMGGSPYRSGATSGPTDTVYLGAFRTDELRDMGGWDEYFSTNQDFELNRRMGRAGLVWYDDRLQVGYIPRPSVGELRAQYHRFGRWKVRYWRRTGDPIQRRQWVLLLGVPLVALAGGVGAASVPHGRRRWMVLSALGALAWVDELGSVDSPRSPASRVVAGAVVPQVGLAWWTGVVREWAAR
jgi:succinoglycan biosynthesis protein ExoA